MHRIKALILFLLLIASNCHAVGTAYLQKGFLITATSGQTTLSDKKFDFDIDLFGGAYEVGTTANPGDYIEFEVIDKDNILGYGENVVLNKYIETNYVLPGSEYVHEEPVGSVIPAGIYLRVRYVSTGLVNVNMVFRYMMHK